MQVALRPPSAAWLLLVSLVTSSACQNTRETLTSEWHQTLEAMTIQPVYPPREDFQVGDIYLRHPEAPALEQWVASMDLRQVGETFYAQRAPFPGSTPNGNVRLASAKSGRSPLRQVVFPEFASVNVRGENLDWLIPSEALCLTEGNTLQGEHEITLRISAAESYGLPFNVISKSLIQEQERDGKTIQLLRPDLGISLPTIARTQSSPDAPVLDRHVRLDVVTEVYYARAIDINVTRVRRRDREEVEPIEIVDAAAQEDNKSLVEALNKRLVAVAPSTPSTTLRILGATDATVVIRRTFKEPIAIGYRSITLTLKRKSGEIVSYDSQTPLAEGNQPRTRKDRFDLPGALALEVADQLHGQGELLEIRYDTAISRWVLDVELVEGAETPFFHLTQRSGMAERVKERSGRLSAEDRRRLQRFVDPGGILFDSEK